LDQERPDAVNCGAAAAEDAAGPNPRVGRKCDQVLDGARAVILARGFEGASVDDIAREAGVSKATMYRYYPDKAALFAAVMQRDCGRQAEALLGLENDGRPLEAVLLDLAVRHVALVLSPMAQGMFRTAAAEAERFPEVGQAFYAAVHRPRAAPCSRRSSRPRRSGARLAATTPTSRRTGSSPFARPTFSTSACSACRRVAARGPPPSTPRRGSRPFCGCTAPTPAGRGRRMSEAEGERIAKRLARSGVASRRGAEAMIAEGRVAVNGRVIDSPALNVSDRDSVTVDGKPLGAPEAARLWRYYKPIGLVTSEADEKGRDTVFAHLPPEMPRVVSVGRLDLNSEGLLLLTNDGALKRRLELPSTGWVRKYRVRAKGAPEDAALEPLRRGVTVEGERFAPMSVTIDRQQGANVWLTVGLREGRNREVRRALDTVGLSVNRLIRISSGRSSSATWSPARSRRCAPRCCATSSGSARGRGRSRRRSPRPGAGPAPQGRERQTLSEPALLRPSRPSISSNSIGWLSCRV
jgi:23S rRNA pseudouridine2605 synthase